MGGPELSSAAVKGYKNPLSAAERLRQQFFVPLLMVFLFFSLSAQAQGVLTSLQQQQELSIEEQPGLEPDPQDERLPPAFQRTSVFFRSSEMPGTIIVHTSERFLYVVQGGNRALRYGIGVGRDGFQWAGLLKISRKAEWPDWIPPPEMIERQPYLPRFMAGGPGNPLGARAMFLAIRSTESMEPTSRKLSGTPCLPAAFAWSIRMSWTCMTAFPSAPKSSSDMLPHFSQPLRLTATRNKVSLS